MKLEMVNLEDYLKLKEDEAREIEQLYRDFIQASNKGEIATSDELWQHFGFTPPAKTVRAEELEG